jgi:methionine-R-sulfoxide reductase
MSKTDSETRTIEKSEAEWRAELTPEQYRVLRQAGTERPFTGAYWNHHENGAYTCAGCGTELFRSDAKFDSGCGWPSFFEAADESKVERRVDNSFGMRRVEVLCRACGGHLGHVFEDGPLPTGERYCINSASIKFANGKA